MDSRSTSRSRPTARARSDPTPSSCFTPQTSPSCSSRPLSRTSTLCRRCSGPSSLETLSPPFSDVGRPLRAAAARPTLPADLSTTSLARTRSPRLSPTRSTQLSTLPLSSERVPLSRRPGFPSPTRPPTTLPSSSASSACRCPLHRRRPHGCHRFRNGYPPCRHKHLWLLRDHPEGSCWRLHLECCHVRDNLSAIPTLFHNNLSLS